MGPMATVETFRRITDAVPARRDQDHLHVVIDSDPSIPDRTAALLDGGRSPVPALVAGAARLVRAGAQIVCMPCNTAHAFLPAVRSACPVPVVDMLGETATVAESGGRDRSYGLLATTGTARTGLYQRAFGRRGLDVVVPPAPAQETVALAIGLVKAGRRDEAADLLRPVALGLRSVGADVAVLGCTEISLLREELAGVVDVLDALQVMVDATVAVALGRAPAVGLELVSSATGPVEPPGSRRGA
jgi:aspartate racemase